MEDILASIRRILSEDEVEQAGGAMAEVHGGSGSDVLALDPSMLVSDQLPPPPPMVDAQLPGMHTPRMPEPPLPLPPPSIPQPEARPMAESLMAPEAAAAAASSMGSLLRTLVSERQQVAVHRGGPTIEDVVREEIRPLLKEWLDTNLPPLVERLVRQEIERVARGGR